ncbi:MAG: hypothetical protein ACFCGT_23350 [Sandaracinaceae bacterium]
MRTTPFALLLATLMAVPVSGCSLIINNQLDPLEGDRFARLPLSARLENFIPHLNQLVEMSVVDSANVIVARAKIDPLPAACIDVNLEEAVPVGAETLEFWADLNNNRMLDNFPADHTWREPLDNGSITFPHATTFTDLVTDPALFGLADLELVVTGLDAEEGRAAEIVYVNILDTEQETGLYYLGSVQAAAIQIDFPGVVDQGSPFILEISFGDGPTRTRCVFEGDRSGTEEVFQLVIDRQNFDCREVPVQDTRNAFEAMDCPRG